MIFHHLDSVQGQFGDHNASDPLTVMTLTSAAIFIIFGHILNKSMICSSSFEFWSCTFGCDVMRHCFNFSHKIWLMDWCHWTTNRIVDPRQTPSSQYVLILESKSPCSMSHEEEQLYFLGVEFNDDWTVRSGPIRKLKGKMFTGPFVQHYWALL